MVCGTAYETAGGTACEAAVNRNMSGARAGTCSARACGGTRRTRVRAALRLLLCGFFLLLLLPGTVRAASVPRTVSVTISAKGTAKSASVKEGDRVRLSVRYKGKAVRVKTLRFLTSKKKTAGVTARGVIKANRAGSVKITIRSRKNKKLRAVLRLKVKPLRTKLSPVKASAGSAGKDLGAAGTAARLSGKEAVGTGTASRIAELVKITTPHAHEWKKVRLKDPAAPEYPADRCAVCGLERWTDRTEVTEENAAAAGGETAGGTAAEAAGGASIVLDADKAASKTEAAGSGKIFMIGDSYGARTNKRGHFTWPYQVAKGLGLTEGQALIACRGGYGFGVGRNFLHLLRLAKKDPEVKLILVVGGTGNDRKQSKAEIVGGMRAFSEEARRRFPNALIAYASPNTHVSNASWLERLKKRRPWYIEACRENGWIYLSGCEKILAGHKEYFVKDGHHPNAEGQVVLGRALLKKLKKAGVV